MEAFINQEMASWLMTAILASALLSQGAAFCLSSGRHAAALLKRRFSRKQSSAVIFDPLAPVLSEHGSFAALTALPLRTSAVIFVAWAAFSNLSPSFKPFNGDALIWLAFACLAAFVASSCAPLRSSSGASGVSASASENMRRAFRSAIALLPVLVLMSFHFASWRPEFLLVVIPALSVCQALGCLASSASERAGNSRIVGASLFAFEGAAFLLKLLAIIAFPPIAFAPHPFFGSPCRPRAANLKDFCAFMLGLRRNAASFPLVTEASRSI